MADGYKGLAKVAGRFGADLDALDPSRLSLTSVETNEGPGIRITVNDASEDVPGSLDEKPTP